MSIEESLNELEKLIDNNFNKTEIEKHYDRFMELYA